jgi:hypothetical protein
MTDMVAKNCRAYVAMIALAAASSLWGCVADRPSRNGVFNENQYVRKSFLVQPGDSKNPDRGWFFKSTVISASTPNPLANVNGLFLAPGRESEDYSNLVRFVVTQDKLQMLDTRELSSHPAWVAQQDREPQVANAWPITNVDLKYRINLDGEKTNFYEENQELPWEQRQWVKLGFEKNDMSDLFAFTSNGDIVQKCTDMLNASATFVRDSLKIDETNNYWEYKVQVTVPIAFSSDDAATCAEAFGGTAQTWAMVGKTNVTMTLLNAFVRPEEVVDGSYVPMPIAEKDPIRRKYGAFTMAPLFRDPDTGLLSAQEFVMRFNPNKPIVFYFAPGVPEYVKTFFTDRLTAATNANVFAKANAPARLHFKNYDADGVIRQVGDPRYSFVNWHSDIDTGSGLLGIAQFFSDPRTGETISASINVFEAPLKDAVQQRLEMFLKTVGAEYLTPAGEFDETATVPGANPGDPPRLAYPTPCAEGATLPLVPADVAGKVNRQSTVFSKMQFYLQKPFATYGYLGPKDFLPEHDTDFFDAYYKLLPYQIYADPAANQFVIPSGTDARSAEQWQALQQVAEFKRVAADLEKGLAPYDTANVAAAVDFSHRWEALTGAVNDREATRRYARHMLAADDASIFSYADIYQKNGRRCVNGAWESRASYTQNLIQSLYMAIAAHEFGHVLGLRHNFMGSVDRRNFPVDSLGQPTLYASSLMDYNQMISEAFFETRAGSPIWGPYDTAALTWIYANDLSRDKLGPVAIPDGTKGGSSGQISATVPWNDPAGFAADGRENLFLFCTDEHLRYTPLCRMNDMGTTPSEIMANAIQQREWNYLWTNFRLYHKFFSTENYATGVARDFAEMRRFASLWLFDWAGGALTNTMRLVGVKAPPGSTAAEYYDQLNNKFNTDLSIANQLAAAYHRAIIQQSSGERPYVTVYDPFFGDVTQQGIQLDKLAATTSFSSIWPAISNYDPSQSGGLYVTSVGAQFGDAAYTSVSQAVLADFLGASFATYTYAQLGPIANFAASTHSALWGGDINMQTWVGGWVFERERDFLDFVRGAAVREDYQNCDENGLHCDPCTSLDHCTWDPRTRAAKTDYLTQSDRYNRFQSPDGRTYIWGYLRSRNQWVLADKDRNIASYVLMLDWNTDVVNGEDDGYNGASTLEYKVRYLVDAFTYFDGHTLAAP